MHLPSDVFLLKAGGWLLVYENGEPLVWCNGIEHIDADVWSGDGKPPEDNRWTCDCDDAAQVSDWETNGGR